MSEAYNDFIITLYHWVKCMGKEFRFKMPENINVSPEGETMTWKEIEREYKKIRGKSNDLVRS